MHRTTLTQRTTIGQTNECAKFHQRLVKITDAVLRQHLPNHFPEIFFDGRVFYIAVVIHQAGGNTQDVAVYGRHPKIKGDGGDGACGIFAQSGELAQCGKIGGKHPVILLHQYESGFFQVAGTAVIAQSLP